MCLRDSEGADVQSMRARVMNNKKRNQRIKGEVVLWAGEGLQFTLRNGGPLQGSELRSDRTTFPYSIDHIVCYAENRLWGRQAGLGARRPERRRLQ